MAASALSITQAMPGCRSITTSVAGGRPSAKSAQALPARIALTSPRAAKGFSITTSGAPIPSRRFGDGTAPFSVANNTPGGSRVAISVASIKLV